MEAATERKLGPDELTAVGKVLGEPIGDCAGGAGAGAAVVLLIVSVGVSAGDLAPPNIDSIALTI
jgi:hypothetical protein